MLNAARCWPKRLRDHDPDEDDDAADDLQRIQVLTECDPCRDGGHDRLERRGEANARGRDEPNRGERERERNDRSDHDDGSDLDVTIRSRIGPRQEPRRSERTHDPARRPRAIDERYGSAFGPQWVL